MSGQLYTSPPKPQLSNLSTHRINDWVDRRHGLGSDGTLCPIPPYVLRLSSSLLHCNFRTKIFMDFFQVSPERTTFRATLILPHVFTLALAP
jgi:hypothetical protein